jgi:signal transduction histidine kinase
MRNATLSSGPTWDTEIERRFLTEYRGAGLNATAYACIAGAAMYSAFLTIALSSEVYSASAVSLRVFLIAMLSATAWVFLFSRDFAQRYYVSIAGLICFVALVGVIAIPHLSAEGAPAPSMFASPAVVFGLFLLYAFLRLPLSVASGIGWVIGLTAAMLMPAVAGGNESMRNIVYLVFANLAGMSLCRTAELRERILFQQRMDLEVARFNARERAAAAEEANREKARLIAAISHDLRQPMAAAAAYLGLSISRMADSNALGALDSTSKASAAVSALGETLDHLLTAARYDEQYGLPILEALDARAIAQEARDSFAIAATARGLNIRVWMSRRQVFALSNRGSISRVLSNLISNAVKFSSAGGRVLVTVRRVRSRVFIEVFDTGIGIAIGQMDEIWRPFVQLGNSERNREHGMGLGLYLVRRIVEQMPGHSIEVFSKLGRGTHFRVALPAASQPIPVEVFREPNATLPSAVDTALLKGAYVLLIEDDVQVRRSIEELMIGWGIVVVAGGTVEGVLSENADSERLVDAIVCDFRLPCSENGLSAVQSVRHQLGYAPDAVLITGESDVERIRAIAVDRVVVLQKPFSTVVLAAHLASATRWSRRDELL